jgi:23S rRNA G2069 N7-methylase RlmK/C1962 C5-methylase RlmI
VDAKVKIALQAEMLYNRLRKRQRHLRKWAARAGTDAYRLYDRDIPEIPLVLDRYQDAAAGALYRRPYEKDPGEEGRWLAAMRAAAAEALETGPDRIFLKERNRRGPGDQYQKFGDAGFIRDVREGGLLFRVNLSDYLDTGLFLDRRGLRALAAAGVAGKRVLNLFCYTAAFSVYAVAGGARTVDSVDLSRTYLEWGAVNFGLNRLEARPVEGRALFRAPDQGPPGRLIRADARVFLEEAARARCRWDLIILDPPAFSNSKKMTGALDIKRDHRELISRCLALLEPGGILWFSAARRIRLESGDFPGFTLRERGEKTGDEDFRGRVLPRSYTLSSGDR